MTPTFREASGALFLFMILGAIIYAALSQNSHDALIALISLVTGTGVGTGVGVVISRQSS